MPGRICHFFLTYSNSNDTRHEAGLASGTSAHLRGWDIGVRVIPRGPGGNQGKRGSEQDRIELAMTGGSRGENEGKATALGTIKATPDGPRWEPATTIRELTGLLATALADTRYESLDADTRGGLDGLRTVISGALADDAGLALP